MTAAPLHALVTTTAIPDVAFARLVLFNAALARAADGRVGVRVPDAEAARAVRAELDWLEVADVVEIEIEGRRPRYVEVARQLIAAGRAIVKDRAVVLPALPGRTVVGDYVKGAVAFENAVLGEIVLLDAQGAPGDAFAAAVDEAEFASRVILREDRDIEQTAQVVQLLDVLDAPLPVAAHIGALLPDAGATLPSLAQLRADGILPAALRDHLVLLGWSPPTPVESFAAAELAAAFSLDRVHPGPAHFNAARLRAFNARRLHGWDRAALAAALSREMQRTGWLETPVPAAAQRWIQTFLDAFGDAFATLPEAIAHVAALRAESVTLPALELERLRNRQVLFYLDAVGQYVDAQPELRDLPLAHDLPAIAQEFGIAHDDAFAAVRMALTGRADGPPLHWLFPLLGHDRILIRLGAISSHLLHGRGLEPIAFGPGGTPFRTIQPQPPG